MSPFLEPRGIELFYETGLFRPGAGGEDYRIPDLLFFPAERESELARTYGIEGAPLAVLEIRSPDDESTIDARFQTVAGPRLRVECDGERRDI